MSTLNNAVSSDLPCLPCRICGAIAPSVVRSRAEFWVQCDECGHAGNTCDSEELCVADWNYDLCRVQREHEDLGVTVNDYKMPLRELREKYLQLDRENDAVLIERDKLREEVERLRNALAAIRQYGSDTLSGRADGGPDDRDWQRDAVREMTRRARVALNAQGESNG